MFPNITNTSVIRCYFEPDNIKVPDNNSAKAEIFFAKTNELISEYTVLEKFIENKDKIRADKFKFDKDRYTYLFCHTLLRLILSDRLNSSPADILFEYDNNEKPCLSGNALFFNISHTRDSFAFIISEKFRVGIDLENLDRNIDINSILRTSFTNLEREFILDLPHDSRNRFFLLWTRKEALLKALGSGITSDLSNIEVLMNDNSLNRISFRNITDDSVFCDHYIYSKKIYDYWISVALPVKSELIFHLPDDEHSNNSSYLLSYLNHIK